MEQRPDQASRLGQPLSPGGVTSDQIAGSGLALDATSQSIVTNTGTTAGNTGSALTVGVPPNVPNLLNGGKTNGSAGGSPYVLATAGGTSRIWTVILSYAVGSSVGYAGGNNQFYAAVQIDQTLAVLAIVELALTDHSQSVNSSVSINLNGLPFPNTDTISLVVNGGTTVANTVQRASCSVLYSTP